ncbi:hypothetical protein BT93_F1240 [Corymbia citriodora subsp. variegata]|nr:hypothetical protein BT93_F1240 [Corymbia citriodora subsp. variegata]
MPKPTDRLSRMNAVRRAWIVAACIGTVESLKDQGICRWNYPLRSLEQHAKNNITSFHEARKISSSSSSPSVAAAAEAPNADKARRTEESLEKVMYLSCWGPNTVRF